MYVLKNHINIYYMHSYHSVINILLECARACEHCSSKCLEEKNIIDLVHCIKLNRECADICLLSSRFLERDSQFTNDILDVCSKVISRCAEECEKFIEYEHCKECFEACRKAEKACNVEI
jgi:hypothetical protein